MCASASSPRRSGCRPAQPAPRQTPPRRLVGRGIDELGLQAPAGCRPEARCRHRLPQGCPVPIERTSGTPPIARAHRRWGKSRPAAVAALAPDGANSAAAGLQNPVHFGDGLLRVRRIHQAESAQGNIESAVFERQLFRIHALERGVGDGLRAGQVARHRHHFLRDVGAHDLSAGAIKDAALNVTRPVPQATSSTRSPGTSLAISSRPTAPAPVAPARIAHSAARPCPSRSVAPVFAIAHPFRSRWSFAVNTDPVRP